MVAVPHATLAQHAIAERAFFLIDKEGLSGSGGLSRVGKRWFPSEPLLKAVQEIAGNTLRQGCNSKDNL